MIIAPAKPDDATGIATIHIRSWQAAYVNILDSEFLRGLSIADRIQHWRTILRKNQSRTLVATLDGQMLGFVSYNNERINSVKIRQYRKSDLELVLDSWETATRLAHEFMSDDFITQERRNVAEIYLPNTDTWVAEIDSEVKGFIALMGNEVGALFLQPDCHGKGIGKALMDKAQALHGDLEVEVFKANHIGRNFYSKYGFEFLEEKLHEPTGQSVLRLRFTAGRPGPADNVNAASS